MAVVQTDETDDLAPRTRTRIFNRTFQGINNFVICSSILINRLSLLISSLRTCIISIKLNKVQKTIVYFDCPQVREFFCKKLSLIRHINMNFVIFSKSVRKLKSLFLRAETVILSLLATFFTNKGLHCASLKKFRTKHQKRRLHYGHKSCMAKLKNKFLHNYLILKKFN